ncbi:amidohydrolase family protein [Candidatus Bipolaricaulota sp. J31]
MRLLFGGGTVCTFDGEGKVLSPGYVGVEEGRIAFVGEHIPPGFSPDRTFDCAGKVVLPGLVNAHLHMGEMLFRGMMDEVDFPGLFYSVLFPWEAALEPEDVYWGTLAAAAEALRCGVTAVGEMYHHPEAAARAVAEVGIRARITPLVYGLDLKDPLLPGGRGLRFDRGAFAEQLVAAVEFASAWAGGAGGLITTGIAPHATNTLEPGMLERVAAVAEERSLFVHMHLAQMESEYAEVKARTGAGCVGLLASTGLLRSPGGFLGAHAIFIEPDEIALLAENGASVAHNPIANAKDAGLVAPIPELSQAGVTIGLGTDAFHSHLLEAARVAAFIHRAKRGNPKMCPAREVLAWATRGGAAALRLDGVGSLEVGNRADLVVVDCTKPNIAPLTDPFTAVVYYAEPANVELVVVDGRVVVEDGRLLTVDEDEIAAEFADAARRLRKRLRRTT